MNLLRIPIKTKIQYNYKRRVTCQRPNHGNAQSTITLGLKTQPEVQKPNSGYSFAASATRSPYGASTPPPTACELTKTVGLPEYLYPTSSHPSTANLMFLAGNFKKRLYIVVRPKCCKCI